jgi:Tfp pilus assembly protein PilP
MNQRNRHFPRLFLAIVSTMLMLPACAPVIDTDMRDLKDWQASVRKHIPADKREPSQAPANTSVKQISSRIIASRDPFALPAPKITMAPSRSTKTADATASDTSDSTPALLHLLGTVRDSGKIYALIEADRQVHCVALKASLPSYPITVFRIANHAVELDRLLPDGSHLRSMLRQGK